MLRYRRAERGRMSSKLSLILPALLVGTTGCGEDPIPTEPEGGAETSMSASAVGADDWIVVFKRGTDDAPGLARRLVAANGGSIRHTYSHAIQGFAGTLPPQAVEAIGQNPNVAYVERDGLMHTTVGSWGLDRIDQRDLPLNNTYSAAFDGTGVMVYIIDTGVDYTRDDQFGSRYNQSADWDFVDNDDDAFDCHGHGTHVAGTVGSNDYGVAPDVTIAGVRVLNCQGSGSYADVIAGIDYVAANAPAKSVANMSLGGGYSSAVNDAVNGAVASEVVFSVSSGNSSADACNYSPASAASAITVNASTSTDARSSFSNYGTCTDIFAPGSGITSTVMGSGTGTWSGTSMASPHVAGVAALILEELGAVGPATVWATMKDRSTRDHISGAGAGTPNLLLYSGRESGDPCVINGCPDAQVESVSTVDIKINKRNIGSGTVTVGIAVSGGSSLSGVTVTGSWTVNGNEGYTTSSGTTGSDGTVTLSTGGIRFAVDFDFCVTGLSGAVVDRTVYTGTEPCAGFGGTSDPPTVDPPAAGVPGGLVVTTEQKGRNWRANLVWSGGGSSVDIFEGAAKIAAGISNSGSYTHNLGKDASGDYTYTVCNAGTFDCSAPESVTITP